MIAKKHFRSIFPFYKFSSLRISKPTSYITWHYFVKYFQVILDTSIRCPCLGHPSQPAPMRHLLHHKVPWQFSPFYCPMREQCPINRLTHIGWDKRWYSFCGCHFPCCNRFWICALYFGGPRGFLLWWRLLLQNIQAATMLLSWSLPPSQRATRCSAVHWNLAAYFFVMLCLLANFLGLSSHIGLPQ